jgi:hypothetical protein
MPDYLATWGTQGAPLPLRLAAPRGSPISLKDENLS